MGEKLTLVDTATRRLEADLPRRTDSRLPSLRVLAQLYQVSLGTISAAVARLRERGLLEFGPGRRMVIAGRSPASATAASPGPEGAAGPRTATAALTRRLRTHLEDGTYQTGERLPKRLVLARQYRVSVQTVARALARLVEANLVHRAGKAWLVGPRPETKVGYSPPPLILVLQAMTGQWRSLRSAERTRKFALAFEQEAQKAQVQLLHASALESRPPDEWIPGGRKAIRAAVREAGHRFRGVLLAAGPRDLADFDAWIPDLLALGQPVVWFDRHGGDGPSFRRHPLLTRCRFDEGAAVTCALTALADLGHRAIGFTTTYDYPWSSLRAALAVAEGQRAAAPLRVFHEGSIEQLMRKSDGDPETKAWLRDATERLLRRSCPLRDELLEYLTRVGRVDEEAAAYCSQAAPGDVAGQLIGLFRCHAFGGEEIPKRHPAYALHTDLAHLTPYMLRYLQTERPTALLSMRDYEARPELRWLRHYGLRLPRDISFLSFDNSSWAEQYPMSSVDFGLGRLGYVAFHALLRDIPVGRDRLGEIPARPEVVHRGTLGPAPRKI